MVLCDNLEGWDGVAGPHFNLITSVKTPPPDKVSSEMGVSVTAEELKDIVLCMP